MHVVTVLPGVARRRGWRVRTDLGYRWSCSCGVAGLREFPDSNLAALDGVEHVTVARHRSAWGSGAG